MEIWWFFFLFIIFFFSVYISLFDVNNWLFQWYVFFFSFRHSDCFFSLSTFALGWHRFFFLFSIFQARKILLLDSKNSIHIISIRMENCDCWTFFGVQCDVFIFRNECRLLLLLCMFAYVHLNTYIIVINSCKRTKKKSHVALWRCHPSSFSSHSILQNIFHWDYSNTPRTTFFIRSEIESCIFVLHKIERYNHQQYPRVEKKTI